MEEEQMANNNGNFIGGCVGRACDWLFTRSNDILCVTGTGSCTEANLLEAEESKFHDVALIDATRKINQILRAIESDPDRHVSFIDTKRGLMLAWVKDHHDSIPSEDGVNIRSDDVTIAMALDLKGLVVEHDERGVPLIVGGSDSAGTMAS
jgi:hypothetical protein